MTRRLEVEFHLENDPDHGAGVSTDESASWGSFKISVDGTNLCKHVAHARVSDKVHWYLLPLLEWFVQNWDSALHESKLPGPFNSAVSARQGFRDFVPAQDLDEEIEDAVFAWWERHSLRAVADGGVFPDVFFRRTRNSIEISWGHAKVEGAPDDLRFLAPSGQALLEPKYAAQVLFDSISEIANKLGERLPGSNRVQALVSNISQLASSRILERSAWMASLGASFEESKGRLAKIGEMLGAGYRDLVFPQMTERLVIAHAPAAVLMFGTLSPKISENDVAALMELLKGAAHSGQKSLLPKVEHHSLPPQAWEQGYSLAIATRESLGIPDFPPRLAFDDILDRVGVAREDVNLSDSSIRAVAVSGEGFRSLIALNLSCRQNESEPGLRFTLAHELCHLLFDTEEGVPLAVVSGQWAPATIEKRANAFAAMFLMPVTVCRELLSQHRDGSLDRDVVSKIAMAFGTGKMATLRHLVNVGLVDYDESVPVEEELTN